MKTLFKSQFPMRRMRWMDGGKAALTAAFACLAAGSLLAAPATIYSNDFESYTSVATGEADTADADPTGDEWNMADDTALDVTTTGAGVQVINWLTNAGGTANQCLLLRPSSEAQVYLHNTKSGSRYQLDFWIYNTRGAASDRNFYIILRGEGSDFNGDDYLAYRTDRAVNSTKLYYYDGVADTAPGGAAWKAVGVDHAVNAWQHHRIVIDPNALTFSLYLDDMATPVLTGADLSRCEVAVPTLLRIVNEGNSADDGWFAIDDLSLTVEGAVDLATTFSDGFESYPARVNADDDADPAGPWVTTEIDGTGSARLRAPGKVQVVDATVVPPHSGNKCLKLEGGQRAGATLAWGVPPQSDVQITWWARVPASVVTVGTEANYLRMSLYGAENYNSLAGDNALLGYGIRSATVGDATSLTYYTTGWLDSGVDYTPDVWEEYRLTTHTAQAQYTIVKNPSSPGAQVVVDRGPFIGTANVWMPVFMAAWSSSNGTNHPPVYIDDIEIKSLTAPAQPLGEPYTPTIYGTRFTNFTKLVLGGIVGRPVVDPRDNTTILFARDDTPAAGGGIYRATQVASGNWVVDPTPVVAGLDRPSGLAITADGTLWWTHDYNNDFTRSVGRLKWPWNENTPETVIADVVDPSPAAQDDDAIDLCVAPPGFSGAIGRPGWIVVADRGVNGDDRNGVYMVDPATTELGQTNYSNFLVNPTATDLGGNLMAIDALPPNEVVVVSVDGFLVAINADGGWRYINTLNLWPLGATATAAAIAVDPISGRIWAADDGKDEIWSIDSTTGEDQREIGFPLTNALRPDRQMDFHDPGLAFAPDGSFLVVSDASTANGGGRLIIFHNQAVAVPDFTLSGISRSPAGVQLAWQSAGAVRYDVLRGTDLTSAASFVPIATNLTATTFTDTNAPAGAAFYRVVAKP